MSHKHNPDVADSMRWLEVDPLAMRFHTEQMGQETDIATAIATVREFLRQQQSQHGTDKLMRDQQQ